MSIHQDERGMSILEVLFTAGIMVIVGAIAVPNTINQLRFLRISGDGRDLANAAMLGKMRAAATFTQARLRVDLSVKRYRIETWNKTGGTWAADGGYTYLSGADTFGYGAVGTPPPSTQVAIGQSLACRDAGGAAIADTACVVFNSRGVPITPKTTGPPDGTEPPIATNGVYLTDGTAVYAATVSASGLIRLWSTKPTGTPSWTQQ
jgi:Tfp pilus assembly protein FimT